MTKRVIRDESIVNKLYWFCATENTTNTHNLRYIGSNN